MRLLALALLLTVLSFGQISQYPAGGSSSGLGPCGTTVAGNLLVATNTLGTGCGDSGVSSTTPSFSGPVTAPQFAGSGSNPYLNLPSNTGHSFLSGDLVNNAGVLSFNDGTGTRTLPTQLTTIGTSGAATLIAGVLNVPQYTSGASGFALISSQVLGSPAASVTFSSIPGTYTTLRLVIVAACSAASQNQGITAQFNGDTSAHYADQFLFGTGGTPTAFANNTLSSLGTTLSVGNADCTTAGSTSAAVNFIDIPGYAGTSFIKKFLSMGGYSASSTNIVIAPVSHIWNQTSAISSIVLAVAGGSNFVTGSTFVLYGY